MTVGFNGVSLTLPVEDIVINLEGFGAPLSTGIQNSYYTVPYDARIIGWYLVGNPLGNIVVDIIKVNYALPNISDTITGSEKPTLNSQYVNQDTNLISWNTLVKPGDTFGVVIESVDFITNCTLSIKLLKL